MGRIISIANQKGGVGKTATAINLSTSIAVFEINTLLIDLDPQANTTSGIRELRNNSKMLNSVYSIFTGKIPDVNSIIHTTELNYLKLIPSNRDLIAAEYELVNIPDREFILNKFLKKIKDRFDYIIIDCPPSLGLLTINALVATDTVLIPLQCEYLALEGLGALLNTIERIKHSFNDRIKIEGILLTMHDVRYNISKQVEENVRNHFGPLVFKTTISRSVRLAESPSHGKPIFLYDARSRAAMQYMLLAKEIIGREELIERK